MKYILYVVIKRIIRVIYNLLLKLIIFKSEGDIINSFIRIIEMI